MRCCRTADTVAQKSLQVWKCLLTGIGLKHRTASFWLTLFWHAAALPKASIEGRRPLRDVKISLRGDLVPAAKPTQAMTMFRSISLLRKLNLAIKKLPRDPLFSASLNFERKGHEKEFITIQVVTGTGIAGLCY